jgi:hypothetical protein
MWLSLKIDRVSLTAGGQLEEMGQDATSNDIFPKGIQNKDFSSLLHL